MSWEFDFRGDDATFLDAGGRVPVGWYLADFDHEEGDQKFGGAKMFFRIAVGAFTGKTISTTLQNPAFADDVDRAKKAADRAKSWAVRMGLVTKEEVARGVKKSLDWNDAKGRRYVIQVQEAVDYKTKAPKNFNEIAYMGVYPVDHYAIPAETRAALNLGPARPKDGAASGSATSAEATATNAGGAAQPGSGTTTQPAAASPAALPNYQEMAKSLWN